MAKKMTNVAELAKDLGYNQEEIHELEKEIEAKSLSRYLTVLRAQQSVTQGEMAEKMKVSQSYISKLENAFNENIGVDEMADYVNALGFEFSIHIGKPKTIVQRIIHAYNVMLSLFKELQKTRREDPEILRGLAKFEFEASKNMLKLAETLMASSGDKLKKLGKRRPSGILINDVPLESAGVEKELVRAVNDE